MKSRIRKARAEANMGRGRRASGHIQTELDVVEVNTPRSRRKTNRSTALSAEMQEMLKATQNLTDAAFEDWLRDRFFRVALLTLAQMAASGNIRALDAYLKRADHWRVAKEQPNKAPQPVGAVSFIPARRIETGSQ